VTVRASTTAASTDWTAKLVDVWSDGRAISVIDGIVRVVTVPGAVTDHLIDLVATSQVFKAGHRIRVEIASSNFPRFDRNLGTGRYRLCLAERCGSRSRPRCAWSRSGALSAFGRKASPPTVPSREHDRP
jgi:putative CocE/NonD family hydrolase